MQGIILQMLYKNGFTVFKYSEYEAFPWRFVNHLLTNKNLKWDCAFEKCFFSFTFIFLFEI